MKRKFLPLMLVAVLTAPIVSCGPSQEEIEAEKKRVADSIATVEAEAKRVSDSIASAEAEAKRVADSIVAAEAEAKRVADSIEAAKSKKGGKAKPPKKEEPKGKLDVKKEEGKTQGSGKLKVK